MFKRRHGDVGIEMNNLIVIWDYWINSRTRQYDYEPLYTKGTDNVKVDKSTINSVVVCWMKAAIKFLLSFGGIKML